MHILLNIIYNFDRRRPSRFSAKKNPARVGPDKPLYKSFAAGSSKNFLTSSGGYSFPFPMPGQKAA